MSTVAARDIWKRADAVCFDVDSTVIKTEGIDELARFAGVDTTELTRRYNAHWHPWRCYCVVLKGVADVATCIRFAAE